MATFKVKMKEIGRDGKVRTIEQLANCETRKQVIDWYGLKEPDIIEYTIDEIKD